LEGFAHGTESTTFPGTVSREAARGVGMDRFGQMALSTPTAAPWNRFDLEGIRTSWPILSAQPAVRQTNLFFSSGSWEVDRRARPKLAEGLARAGFFRLPSIQQHGVDCCETRHAGVTSRRIWSLRVLVADECPYNPLAVNEEWLPCFFPERTQKARSRPGPTTHGRYKFTTKTKHLHKPFAAAELLVQPGDGGRG